MQTRQKGIISLVVILSVGFFALAVALTAALNSFAGLLENRNTKFGDLAFYTSEAAAKEGVFRYREDISYSGGSAELLNQSSEVNVSVTPLDWPYVEVEASAANNFSFRENVLTLTLFAEGLAFNYAVFSETALNFKGNITVNGNIFANEGIDFSGSSAEIIGDAFSPENIEDGGNIRGNIYENVESIPPPSIDIEEYRSMADFVFDNSSDAQAHINGQTLNEVVFVDDPGKTNIQGSTDFTGCLAVKGDLDITGGVFTAREEYPAVIVEGDLKIAGGATINGIVFVTGKTSFGGGNNTINGSLLSVGEVTKTDITGNTTINFDPDYVSIWQGIPGLDTTSSAKPRIIDWREE